MGPCQIFLQKSAQYTYLKRVVKCLGLLYLLTKISFAFILCYMRLTKTETEKLARSIIKQIKHIGIGVIDEEKAIHLIINLFHENMEDEKKLEEDALKLLKQHRNAMGAGLDEDKALRLIKQKLANDRKFVL